MQKSIATAQVIKKDLKNLFIGSTITSILLSILVYLIWSQIFIETDSLFQEFSNTYYITMLINVHLAQSIMIYTFTNTRFPLFLAIATVKTFVLFIAPFLEIFYFNYDALNYQISITFFLLYLIFKNFSLKVYIKFCLVKAEHFVNIFKLYITSLRYYLIINSGSVFWVIFASSLASVSIENLGIFRIIGFVQSGIGILGVVLNSIKLGVRGENPDPKKLLDSFLIILSLGFLISITILDYVYLKYLAAEYSGFASVAFISVACICVITLLHNYLNENLAYVNSSNLLLLIPVAFLTTGGILSLLTVQIYIGYFLEFLIVTTFYFVLKLVFKKNTSWLELCFFSVVALKVLFYVG
jgi:hypothetical protein